MIQPAIINVSLKRRIGYEEDVNDEGDISRTQKGIVDMQIS